MKRQDSSPASFPILASSYNASVPHLGINPMFSLTQPFGKFILNLIGPSSIAGSVTSDIQTLIFEVGESFIEQSEENLDVNLLMQGQVNPSIVLQHLIEHCERTNALVQDVALLKVSVINHCAMSLAEMRLVVVTTCAPPKCRKESLLF